MYIFISVDPLAEKTMEPYSYVGNNPIMFNDPTGMSKEGGEDWVERTHACGFKEIVWEDNVSSSDDSDLKDGDRYLGKAVVVFDGSRSEKKGKGDSIKREGAVTAKVTVYGPGGKDDVTQLEGFTMTSDPEKYTPIDEGEYTATRREYTGSGSIPKQYQMFENGKDNIRTMDGVKNSNVPTQVRPNGDGYKTEIFIHRTNNNNWMGGRVSVGCLLLTPSSMKTFDDKLKPLGNGVPFKVILNRNR